jgi:hypothetical protein
MKESLLQKEPLEFNEDFQNDLSIQAGLDGFSFMVRPAGSDAITYFRHNTAQFTNYNLLLRNFRALTEGDAISNRVFNKVSFILSDRNFSLIPTTLYSEKLLNFLFPAKQKPDPREIIVNHVEHPDAMLAFSIPKSIADFVIEKFPGSMVEHEASKLISNFKNIRDALFIHFHNSWFYAINGSEDRHFFINNFEFREETDIFYYLTAIIQHLDLKENPVYLSGEIGQNDEKYLFLKKNLPRVEILTSLPGKPISLSAGEVPFQMLPGMIIL